MMKGGSYSLSRHGKWTLQMADRQQTGSANKIVSSRLAQISAVANVTATISPLLAAACLQFCVFRVLWEQVHRQGVAAVFFFFCLTINAEENLHPSVLLKEGKQSAWGVKGSDLFGSCSAPANTAESLQFPAVPWGYHFICVFSCA